MRKAQRHRDEHPAAGAVWQAQSLSRLGIIEEGALADLLLVDGDPFATIGPVADPGKNFLVIMKDGLIYKNMLEPSVALTGN